jgi:hypothetical protein
MVVAASHSASVLSVAAVIAQFLGVATILVTGALLLWRAKMRASMDRQVPPSHEPDARATAQGRGDRDHGSHC